MVEQIQAFPNIQSPLARGRLVWPGGREEEFDTYITPPFQFLLQSLWDRTGAAQGVLSGDVALTAAAALAAANTAQGAANAAQVDADAALAAIGTLETIALVSTDAVGGWASPTGSGLRTAFDMNWTTVVSVGYVQSELVSVRDQVIALGKRLGQLELDLLVLGAIKP